MVERISHADESLFQFYAEHIQRYEFALPWCREKRVLDAGCGTGYGSYFLKKNGAASVHGIDISHQAIAEALHYYRLPNLTYALGDVEKLSADFKPNDFDVIVNFENLEHLHRPELLIKDAATLSRTFITSTPNGENTIFDAKGNPSNPFHVKEFKLDELKLLISNHFEKIRFYGQYLTPVGRLRQLRSRELFEQLCEAYYNPAARVGRLIKRLSGRKAANPPRFNGPGDRLPGDFVIQEMGEELESPSVLIAVCSNSRSPAHQ